MISTNQKSAKTGELSLLDAQHLSVEFQTAHGVVKAVDDVSFRIRFSETIALVGESGCGKSVTAQALLKIVQPPGKITGGSILLKGRGMAAPVNISRLSSHGKAIRNIRGRRISMIFQDPMTCLSPVHTVGNQIVEAIRLHGNRIGRREARDRAVQLLEEVGIPNAAQRYGSYTFELSGGLRQRAAMAVALASEPELLIADEPTTALDVTIQALFLDLLQKIQKNRSMSVLFITHDLGVVAKVAKRVMVMYLGRIVEQGPVKAIYDDPLHPYTQLLLKSITKLQDKRKEQLPCIAGAVPDPLTKPAGCLFHDRCPAFMPNKCDVREPLLIERQNGHEVRCLLYEG